MTNLKDLKSFVSFKKIIKKFDIMSMSMIAGAVTALFIACFTSFAKECERMPDEVLRLHILANSNNERDQDLKYNLRDFLLSDLEKIFEGAQSQEQAYRAAEKNLEYINQRAQKYIFESGHTYDVKAELAEMYFTTRVYENITMPAGNYKTIRLVIGKGGGQNWWCVMFPPLCLPAASRNENKTEPYFSKEVSKTIESGKNGVEVRFALFEWLESLFI